MWILWDLAFETLSLYSVAAFGRAVMMHGIVMQVEPLARCLGCLRKCTWRWDVVAQQPGLGQGEGLRASIDCQAAHLGGQACSDPCLL